MFVRYQNARTVFIVLGVVAVSGLCCAGGFAWSLLSTRPEPPPPDYTSGPPEQVGQQVLHLLLPKPPPPTPT